MKSRRLPPRWVADLIHLWRLRYEPPEEPEEDPVSIGSYEDGW